jgi:DNA-binding MarR family transcriptional regulator
MAQGGKGPGTSLVDLLHRASQRADGLFTRNAREHRLTPRQFAVLTAVAGREGLSQTAVMAATGNDRSSTADLVRRLVVQGMLQRKRTRKDARLYAIRLTPKGEGMLAAGEPAAQATDRALLALVPTQQRGALFEALRRIADAEE